MNEIKWMEWNGYRWWCWWGSLFQIVPTRRIMDCCGTDSLTKTRSYLFIRWINRCNFYTDCLLEKNYTVWCCWQRFFKREYFSVRCGTVVRPVARWFSSTFITAECARSFILQCRVCHCRSVYCWVYRVTCRQPINQCRFFVWHKKERKQRDPGSLLHNVSIVIIQWQRCWFKSPFKGISFLITVVSHLTDYFPGTCLKLCKSSSFKLLKHT